MKVNEPCHQDGLGEHRHGFPLALRGLVLVGLAIALLLSTACGQKKPESEVELPPPSPTQFPTRPPKTNEAERKPLPDDVQIYRDESELFALALPANYEYEIVEAGITFLSDDGSFGGVVQHQTTEVENITPDSLGEVLKQTIESQFLGISWQSELQEQADGSFRLDWHGTNDLGEKLDALSFIEQHDKTLYMLTAYGIDSAYSEYNEDAKIIIGTYVVQENPSGLDEAELDDGESGDAEIDTNNGTE